MRSYLKSAASITSTADSRWFTAGVVSGFNSILADNGTGAVAVDGRHFQSFRYGSSAILPSVACAFSAFRLP